MDSRRAFLKKIIMLSGMFIFRSEVNAKTPGNKITKDASSSLYRAVNGTPLENITKVIDLIGGIEKIVGVADVVVIKPNVQWWNQGTPNLLAVKTFVELIMERRGGFKGEVVIAENCHRGKNPWDLMNTGWARQFKWNSDVQGINNFNELVDFLKRKYDSRFSVVYWLDIDEGGRRIFSPQDGNGYIYCDGTGGIPLIKCDNEASGEDLRETIMTYPIFTTDRGTVVDFKNGIWENGQYTHQPLRFINFPALNHHSQYGGATSAVKNYMGVTDLSGGTDPHNGGLLSENYYNFHSFPFNKWSPGPVPGMLGKSIGTFMNTIRKADLNITTAEFIGLSSRTDPPLAHTRAVIACTDAVALDYHSAKYILYPNSMIDLHDPDNNNSPLNHYLMKCSDISGDIFNEEKVKVISYDFKKGSFQGSDELVVNGKKKWGNSLKAIGKYLVFRYLS